MATVPIISASCIIGALGLGLWTVEHNQKVGLERERAQTAAMLDQAKARIQELTDRVNTLEQQRPAQSSSKPDLSMSVHTGTVNSLPRTTARRATVAKRSAAVQPDPRINRLEGELADTRKELATTRDQLTKSTEELDGKIDSTRGDLSGSIARTHDEVVALQKRGERNIYEFKLTKSKELQHVGPLSLSLRSTSTKHKTYDLAMMVDDNSLSKKHINLYEPVWITMGDRPQPVQLVVNRVTKDNVEGYVSEPKYRNSELSASTNQLPSSTQQQLGTRHHTDEQ
jgi:hypothetical protein